MNNSPGEPTENSGHVACIPREERKTVIKLRPLEEIQKKTVITTP